MPFSSVPRRCCPLLLAASLVLLAPLALGGLRAEVTAEHGHLVDLGTAPTCEPARGTIVLRNGGTEDVVIQSITTTCGCTVADPPSRTIPAGGLLDIPVTLTSLASAETLLEHVDMDFSDGTRLRVSVRAKFAECFTFPPALPILDLGTRLAQGDAPLVFHLPFCFRAAVAPDVVSLQSVDDRVEVSITPRTDHAPCAAHVDVTVTFRDRGVLGLANIPLPLDVLGQRINGVAIRGKVVSADVEPSDSPLFFGSVRVGKSAERSVTITPSREGIDAVRFETEAPFEVTASETTDAAGSPAWRATVACSPASRGSVRGLLHVEFRVAEGTTRRVAVPLVATAY